MTTDLVDAARWVVDAGIADPARISYVGFSYGGYASLDAATAPATRANVTGCVASLGGATEFDSVASLQPPGFARPPPPGGPAARADRDAARAVSPLHNVAGLGVPLMQAAGAGDDRALVRGIKQFNTDARRNGVRTELYLYEGEGHTLLTDEDRTDYQSRLNLFLSTCGGGRATTPLRVEGVKVDTVNGPDPPPKETREVRMDARPTPYSKVE